jgi:GT2 family glycosyltransferase
MSYHDITVVITTFRSENKIIPCLDSINPNLKVLIIENSSNEQFKINIEKKYKNVKCIISGKNLGYAKGNNFGLSKVKTKYALIINPDASLEKEAVNNFFISAERKPDFCIISPLIQEEKERITNKYLNKKDLIEIENVKGFAMFLNMKELEDVGYFDENFFIYFEEIDFCRRIKNKKKKIYLDPNISIFHKGGSSHDDTINDEMELSRNWHWMWSTFYYHKKYNGFIFSFIKIFPKLFSSILRMIIYSLIFNKKKRAIYFARFSGIINSIRGKKSWYRPNINDN